MRIQLVVEGAGILEPKVVAEAVDTAAAVCPRTRLVRRSGHVQESGLTPQVRVLDGDAFDRETFMVPVDLLRHLPSLETTECLSSTFLLPVPLTVGCVACLRMGGTSVCLVKRSCSTRPCLLEGCVGIVLDDLVFARGTAVADLTVLSDDLAYVVDTSGCPRWPNGVEIEHRAALADVRYAIAEYGIDETRCFPLFTVAASWARTLGTAVRDVSGGSDVTLLGGSSITFLGMVAAVCRELLGEQGEREFMAAVGRIITEPPLDQVADLVRTTGPP